MTVGDLKKAIAGLPDNMPVEISLLSECAGAALEKISVEERDDFPRGKEKYLNLRDY